jgi:undecaprenol kinase
MSQPNFQVHMFFALLVIFAGRHYSVTSTEWLILIFTIVLVFTAEMINTSIECMTDMLTPDYHIAAKRAKDVAAGMVLLSALFAVIIGITVFLPYMR